MTTAVKEKVEVNVIGLGTQKKVKAPHTLTMAELKELTGLDGTLRINGKNSIKDHDTVHLNKGDMVSKEMPKISHG